MHKLSSKTSNLISSAQVATSVSNVVKELIENALDADSTSIQIKLDEFGMKKIDVKDNGNGIKADYVQFFGQRHYTSKLKEEKDLLTLLTYGFRGEALSSICEVADVSVITKTCNDPHSTAYTLNSHGAVTAMRPSHLGQGTTVLVSNLFKNLPVRKNYFATAKKRKEQLRHTEELLMAFALANPLTHFSLSNNKSLLWQKPKSKSLNEAVANVFDATTIQNMEEKTIKSPDQSISIHAFVPKKIILRRTNDRCFVLINKRPVRDKQIDKSIRTILCKGESEKENQSTGWPAIVLSITLPTETVDVNVNPNKTQVFLSVKDEVLQLLESLLNASVNPGTSLHNTTENQLSLKSQYSLFDADTNSQVNRLQSTLNDADLPSFPDFLEVNASKPTFTNCSVLMSDTTIDSFSCLGVDFSTSSDSTSRVQESTDNQGTIDQNGYSAQENSDQNRKIMKSAVHNDTKSLKCLNTVVSPSSCNSNLTECKSDHNLNLETNRKSDEVFHLSTSEDERVQSKCIQDITQQNFSTILKKAHGKQTHKPILDHGDAWSRGMAATDSLGNYLQPVTVCTGIKRNARTSCSPSTEATHAKKPRTVFDVLNESARGLNWDCASANLKKTCLSVASKEYDDHRKAIKKANTMNSPKQGRKIRNSFINLNQKRKKEMQLEEEDVVETPQEIPIKFGMNCLKNSCLNLPLSTSYINVIGLISGHYAAVASLSKTLYWVNLHRLYEQSTYEKLIENHIFQSIQCEAIEMTMDKFEGAEFSLLGRFQTSVNLCGKEEILDERLASNGYKVEIIKTETSETFNLVGVPDRLLNHSPLQNISEILKEIYKDACVPIGRCRPLNAINYLRGESAREAKSAPLMTNIKEVEDCINSLKNASSSLVQEKCFHNKPILIKLANIGWSG